MELELTTETIGQIIRTARVLDSGFTEEQLKWLIEVQKQLADSGFAEAAWAVARFEREKDVSCVDILDACERLVPELTGLKAEKAQVEKMLKDQRDVSQKASQRLRRLRESTEQAEQELAQVNAEREREERQLVVFRQKCEKEKQNLESELEDCRQKAKLDQQEIAVAGDLKAQVESGGFSLEEVLGLAAEFAGHKDAREKLAQALKNGQTITQYIKALEEGAANRKKTLESELAALDSRRNQQQAQLNGLEEIRRQLEISIAQLQTTMANEEELRRFYFQCRPISGLLDCLLSWKQVFFYRCNHPISAATAVFDQSAVAHFWTDKPAVGCPHCGSSDIVLDEKPYRALNWPVGAPLKLKFGE